MTYLQSLSAIDANRVGGLAVCASAGYMAHAIAEGGGVKSFATVAAWLHDPQTVGQIYSDDRSVQRFIAAGEVARREFEQTGKVEYVAAHSSTDRNAAMLGAHYYSKPDRGAIAQWKNQFAVMSWSEWLRFDALAPAPKIAVPTLLVHSDNSALPDNVRRFYNNVSGPKDLFWTQGQHSDFYDKEPYVTKAVQAAAAHFNATLSNAKLSPR